MFKRIAIIVFVLALAPALAAGSTKWESIGGGELVILNDDLQPKHDSAGPAVCPLEHTDVKIQVRGPVAEVTVTQKFHNPTAAPVEAAYVFPLPQDAAVNATEMHVGDRVLHGRIDRREAARQTYEKARDEGRRASLLEQERPNIFTQSVANIQPGEKVDVVIRYVQLLPYADSRFELVYPMVVGPRFIPGNDTGQTSGTGRIADTDEVPDASRITPVALGPGERLGHDINVSVDLDAGVPLGKVTSRAHRVTIKPQGGSGAAVALTDDDRIPNKDFVLNWQVASGQPEIGVLTHHDGKSGYFVMVVQPPESPQGGMVRAREVVCVMDRSGSMSGKPLELSRKAVLAILDGLRPGDFFNIVDFGDGAETFEPTSVPATEQNLRAGRRYVKGIQAGGGTYMLRGVEATFAAPVPEHCVRVIAFFTDGYIGNDAAVIADAKRRMGDARLFSFGVGSSVNRYLLDRLAKVGRGTAQYVLLDDDPAEAAKTFAARIGQPVLTDISIDWGGLDVARITPSPIPDCFAGVPVYVVGRYTKPGEATVQVKGRIGEAPSVAKMQLKLPGAGEGSSPLPTLWARRQIMGLELDKMGSSNPGRIEKEITELALSYSLMSQYTSFVIVEETPPATPGGRPTLARVPVATPAGVSHDASGAAANNTGASTYSGNGSSGGFRFGGGGGFGGGPIGPVGLALAAGLGLFELTRRKRKGAK